VKAAGGGSSSLKSLSGEKDSLKRAGRGNLGRDKLEKGSTLNCSYTDTGGEGLKKRLILGRSGGETKKFPRGGP